MSLARSLELWLLALIVMILAMGMIFL